MSIKKILMYPDPRLLKNSLQIEKIDTEVKEIAEDLLDTMYSAEGVGLAAPQIGINRRIFVMDISNERDNAQVFINPVIKSKNNIKMGEMERCLSCPDEEVKVSRSISVNLEWFCEHGKKQHKTFYHLPCRVVLHEMDHLNNKLILDYKV